MNRFISNLPFKIVSLILALILWFYVAGELERGLWWRAEKRTFYEVPIKILGLPDKGLSIQIKPESANVTLSSSKRGVENISQDDVILFVNLTSLMPASYEVPIETIVPRDLNVVKIEPSRVVVTINSGSVNPFSFGASADKQQNKGLIISEQELSETSF